MRRRRFIFLAAGAGSLLALPRGVALGSLKRVERSATALGSKVSLVAYHEDPQVAETALESAFRKLEEIEELLSLYRTSSQICQLNRTGRLENPHPHLARVLSSALNWSRRTQGAFDPTVQPLWNLYATSKGSRDPMQLEPCRRLVDWHRIKLNPDLIELGRGQSVTLNGIAQGYAADCVRDVLQSHGIHFALANTGEFGALGRKPDGEMWRVGIQHPRNPNAHVALAALDGRFLATSGDYETTFSPNFADNHIFDPVTGKSPTTLSSVTVLAPTGMEADALSTAMFVLGPDKSLELANSLRGVELLLVTKAGDIITTPNFPRCA